jgi:hypothetical protein
MNVKWKKKKKKYLDLKFIFKQFPVAVYLTWASEIDT